MVRKQPTCGCRSSAILFAVGMVVACGRPMRPSSRPRQPVTAPSAVARPARRVPSRPAPPGAHARRPRAGGAPLSEAAARAILFARFRRAGFRVLVDYRLRMPGVDVTLDGFDPDARVGYEYVARAERGTDLSPAERRRLAVSDSVRVLVIDAAGARAVRAAADRFLSAVTRKP